MPFVLPADPTAGAVAPASWGDDVRNALNFLANPPACRVYHSANQSIATNSLVTLAFDSERFDTDTMHSTVTNNSRITINTAGIYLFTASIYYSANATGRRSLNISRSGTTDVATIQVQAVATPAVDPTHLQVATVYKCSAGDWFVVQCAQNSGATLTATSPVGHFNGSEFSATWIGTG